MALINGVGIELEKDMIIGYITPAYAGGPDTFAIGILHNFIEEKLVSGSFNNYWQVFDRVYDEDKLISCSDFRIDRVTVQNVQHIFKEATGLYARIKIQFREYAQHKQAVAREIQRILGIDNACVQKGIYPGQDGVRLQLLLKTRQDYLSTYECLDD